MKKLRVVLVAMVLVAGFAIGATGPAEAAWPPPDFCPLFACDSGIIFHCCADENGSYAHCYEVCSDFES